MVEVEESEKRGGRRARRCGASLGSAAGSATVWRTICARWGGGSNPYRADATVTPAPARILYGFIPPFARVPAQVQSLIMDIHVNHLAPATIGRETSLVDEASLFA